MKLTIPGSWDQTEQEVLSPVSPLRARVDQDIFRQTIPGVWDQIGQDVLSQPIPEARDQIGQEVLSQPGLETLSQAGLEVWEDPQAQVQGYLQTQTLTSVLQTSAYERAVRLAALIRTGCPDVIIEPDLEPPRSRVSIASSVSHQEAYEILVMNRSNSSSTRPKLRQRNPSDRGIETFNDDEKSHALKSAIELGRVDLAEALLDMGMNVNEVAGTIKSGILGRRRVTSITVNYVSIATLKNDVDMVNLFASRGALSESLEDALFKAVRQNLPRIVECLLQYETDPNAMNGEIFESAVTSQKPVLVRLLLRGRIKVSKENLTKNLLRAVEQGQAELVSLLVTHGANVNYRNAAALRKAVQDQRIDIVLVIMKGKPSAEAVSSVFYDAFSINSVITPADRNFLMELLLCGGAQGDCVDETLVRVVRVSERSLSSLLIQYGASLDYNQAESLRIAVRAGDLSLVRILLQGCLRPEYVIDQFDEIGRPFVKDQTHEIMSMLLSKAQGAAGMPLDKALVISVEQRLINITELLLNYKASVNYNGAQALQICVSAGDLESLKLLLSKGRPQQNLMQHVLPQIPSGVQRVRYGMTKLIIDAAKPVGIPTPILDTALLKAVDSVPEPVDLDLVNLILNAGANVNCMYGRCLLLAMQRSCIELLELLVRHNPDPAFVSGAVTQLIQLKEPILRRKAATILLEHGAQASDVSKVLDDILDERGTDEELVHLLLTKADTSYRRGRLFYKVVVLLSPSIVSSILEFNKPDQTALVTALPALLDPRTRDRQAKLRSLLRAGTVQEALDNALIREIKNGATYDLTVVKILLDHGASCDYNVGKALELAMSSKNVELFETLLGSKPDNRILTSVLPAAMDEVEIRLRYKFLSLLLQGGAQGDQVHRSLITEVNRLSSCNLQVIRVLLKHGARVDYSSADAIKQVVSQPLHIDILKAFVQGNGAQNTLASLIPLAMSHEQGGRIQLLSVIFSGGASSASEAEINAALVQAVSEGPASQPSIGLLLENNASPDFENGRAIKVAAAYGYDQILERLLNHSHDPKHRTDALEVTMQENKLNLPRRLSSVRLLTRAGVDLNTKIHNALIQAVQERDHALVQCLLDSHADPAFENGKSIIIASEQVDIKSLELLATANPHHDIYSNSFGVIANDQRMSSVNSQLLMKARKHLLQHGASGRSVDQMLLDHVTHLGEHRIDEEFVDLLLTNADINYRGGQLLNRLVVLSPVTILSSVLESKQPNQTSLLAALPAVFVPDTKDRQGKLELLLQVVTDRKALSMGLINEISNGTTYDFSVVRMLLDHGASCDDHGGKAIELAILSKNAMLLEQLLNSKPDQNILASMLPLAMNEVKVRLRYKFVSLLLHGGAQGDQVHRSLITEVKTSSSYSLQVVEVLLKHGARVNYSNADAIKYVVSQPLHIDILNALVQGNGAQNALASLIPLSMAHQQEIRLQLLPIIFSGGASSVSEAEVNAALVQAVSEGPASQPTISLLLENNASPDFQEGQAIKLAAANGYGRILGCLLSRSRNLEYRADAVDIIMRENGSAFPERLSLIRLLTKAGVDKSTKIHNALTQAVREQDHNLIHCLLESDADPAFDNGKSVIIATRQLDIKSLELLARAKPQRDIYTKAFEVVADDQRMMNVDYQLLLKVRQHLLQSGASGSSVDQKFLDYMTPVGPLSPLRKEFLKSVLVYDALNIDFKGGQILCNAVRKNAQPLLKVLLSREPNVNTLRAAFCALLESSLAEDPLLAMVNMFIEHSGDRKRIYFEEAEPSKSPFYLVLHNHPDKPKLLQYLLDNGCSTEVPFTWIFRPDHGTEKVSALLWLLSQADSELDTGMLTLLLKNGGMSDTTCDRQVGMY
jgi:ankyrin repeat protein